MVTSEKYKYVFIGIPYSGSTAISKELCLLYDGEAVLAKHSNIQMLLHRGIDLSSCTVAAVLRDPYEMMRTHFYNMKNPPPGWFEDAKYNIENGGHLRKIDRQRYAVVQREQLSFSDYVKRYHLLPYDTFFSLNKPYVDFVIEFSDLSNSFRQFLLACGIEPVRDLPIENKSSNKSARETDNQATPVCLQPFMYENRQLLKLQIDRPNILYYQIYRLLQRARFARWKRYDKKMPPDGYCSYYELVRRLQADRQDGPL